jgi:hypothetical protein
MCLDASDIIAICAVFIAIIVPLVQTAYERRHEWHHACELLFKSIDMLYEDIRNLAISPNGANHISYQYFIDQRQILLIHYSHRFLLKKKKIKKAHNIIKNNLRELLLNVSYEELIIKGYENKTIQEKYYLGFVQEIRNYTSKASKALIN